jgi:hypothetical protein
MHAYTTTTPYYLHVMGGAIALLHVRASQANGHQDKEIAGPKNKINRSCSTWSTAIPLASRAADEAGSYTTTLSRRIVP